MLQTLQHIGNILLDGKGVWAQLTSEPKYDPNKKNWICPILFDCVNKEIRILKEEMELFKPDESAIDFRFIPPSLWGPRGKKCALTVATKNFNMLEESLFGKNEGEVGSMLRAIEELPEFTKTPLYGALKDINTTLDEHRGLLNLKKISKELDSGSEEEVILYTAVVRSNKVNSSNPIKLFELDGFDSFIISKFGTTDNGQKGTDYITGLESDSTLEASFSGRYNINKIFQTTSFNYASDFSSFKNSFQANPESIAALDKASSYVLKNLQTRIAGITHIIVPNYRSRDLDEFDLGETELYLNKSSDLLFKHQSLETLVERELPPLDLFWINYIAFESDGNSFKIINQIKDVSNKHLERVSKVFASTGLDFKDYIGGKTLFNLQSIYYIIPVRDGSKSKLNPALSLFKDILEQRKISSEVLFNHFTNLLLCHWYGRYAAYKNINSNLKDAFDIAVKDAVYKYAALFYALKQLNLLDMENETTQQEPSETGSEFQQRIELFFTKMDYTDSEKALFYLGRILNSVARAQYDKQHESKPVLRKVNFNGMDAEAIARLSLDLREKVKQYNIYKYTDWSFSKFTDLFNYKNWPLKAQESVFYLMAGYSFGLTKSDDK